MKLRLPTQLIVALAIVVVGGGALGGEYLLVRWYPQHQQNVMDAAQKLLPYRNDGLGLDMRVAAGIYGKVVDSPGGVRIYRPKLFGDGPSLTITSQPNPDGAVDFSQEILAQWETRGALQTIPRFRFEHTQINGRNAALVWQLAQKNEMLLTAHLISPDRIIEVDCTPGMEDEDTYLQACDSTIHAINMTGPPTPQEKPTLEEVKPAH
ncbi:MAG TPA: hypothetical protein VI455_10900 [Terriglobia bacterium]